MANTGGIDAISDHRFGRYAIVRRIGAGGMGDVYEGRHVDLDKRVAIKTLRRERADNAEARARFLREGQAAAKVRHPNVVEVSDVGSADGVPYLVMEYLEGEDLASWLARERSAPTTAVVDVMLPVMAAVGAAHDESVLHRDLKPSNIFLSRTRDGEVVPKVVDFGVSWFASAQPSGLVTHENAIVGTPAYMSPEQTRGAGELTAASDQYALGVILYECLTGRLPVEPGPVLGMLLRIGQGQFAPPRAVRPELSAELERVVLRAMALDPSQRYGSVRELGRALLPFAGERARLLWRNAFERRAGEATTSSMPPTPVVRAQTTLGSAVRVREVASRSMRTPPRLAVIGLLAVGAGALVGAVGLVTVRRAPKPRPAYEVQLEVDPPSATVTVDGVAAGAGALRRRFAGDGVAHVVSVSAPGHASQEVLFVDAPPARRRVVLSPVDPPAAPRAVDVAPTVSAPSSVAVAAVPVEASRHGATLHGARPSRVHPPRDGHSVLRAPVIGAPPRGPTGTNGVGNL